MIFFYCNGFLSFPFQGRVMQQTTIITPTQGKSDTSETETYDFRIWKEKK